MRIVNLWMLVILMVALPAISPATENMPKGRAATPHNDRKVQRIAQGDWLSYEPAVVELRGKLTSKWFYGPPNYGENPKTDSKELLPILLLSEPVNVRGKPDPNYGSSEYVSVKNVRRMELVLRIPHKYMIGKNVVVKGTLFHALTGHHHTEVLVDVQSIRLVKSDNLR